MPSMAAEVAQTLGDVESVPSCNSPMPPSNVAHDTEPSSDAERAADATNEPQPGGSLNEPSNSTSDSLARRDRSDDNRDDERMPVATRTFILDGGDGSDYADDSDAVSTSSLDSLHCEYIEENGRTYHARPKGESYWYWLV